MTSFDVPRNSSQKVSASFGINLRTTTTPYSIYICPAGKKAHIKGTVECDSTGAAINADLIVSNISVAEWQATGGRDDQNKPQELSTGVRFNVDVRMNELTQMELEQTTGTNASFRVNLTIEESSAWEDIITIT